MEYQSSYSERQALSRAVLTDSLKAMKPSSRRFYATVFNRAALRPRARQGFTLIEILVALALFMIMLAIVFIPMNLGINMFHIGKARSEAQGAAIATMNQLEDEIHRAIYIYPNSALPGVTDQAPYSTDGTLKAPYYQVTGSIVQTSGACSGASRASNISRVDFLLPDLDSKGTVQTPVTPAYYIVTYYARRLDATKPFDIIDNPIVLFRAQIPYRRNRDSNKFWLNTSASDAAPNGPVNADTTSARYPSLPCSDADISRGSLWLTQSQGNPAQGIPAGEPNLGLLTPAPDNKPVLFVSTRDTTPQDTTEDNQTRTIRPGPVEGTHTLATPRGMALVARTKNGDQAQGDMKGVAFVCADSDGDGKIDRVTINLSLGQYDSAGGSTRNGQGSAQSAQLSQTVELPNIPKG